MKQLVCEMCGSTDLIKDDGVFVCQSCGCKNSVEEAKRMMVEGVVEVQGTVKVDNTQLIGNYLSMAQNAADSNNQSEAEDYANKVLELEPTNWAALYAKGNAAGWQSGTRNNRLPEAIDYFSQAIANCEDESNLAELRDNIAKTTSELVLGMIGLRCDNFAKFPSVDNAQYLISEAQTSLILAAKLITSCGIVPDDFKAQAATLINASVVKGWKSIWSDYTDDKPIQKPGRVYSSDYVCYSQPSDNDWKRFYKRADACTSILVLAINLDNGDDEADLQRYNNLIFIAETIVDSHSIRYCNAEWGIGYSFTESAKTDRRQEIAQWKAERENCKKRVDEKKAEAYWESNPEKRESIQNQIAECEAAIDKLISDTVYLENKKRVDEFEQSRKKIETSIAKCSLFNNKDKKRLRNELKNLEENTAPYREKVQEIEAEIESDRQEIRRLQEELLYPNIKHQSTTQ